VKDGSPVGFAGTPAEGRESYISSGSAYLCAGRAAAARIAELGCILVGARAALDVEGDLVGADIPPDHALG
jgi:hypothetical protein